MAGMDDYIAKPIKPVELHAVIERVMGEAGFEDLEPELQQESGVDVVTADLCVADLGATRDLLDGDEVALQQLIRLFFSDFERNRQNLEHAQMKGDLTTIRNLAHSIKGSAGVFNAVGAVAAAQRLELVAKDGDTAGVKRELPLLLAELGNLAGVLRRARKSA